MRAAFMRQGNSNIIILLHVGTRSFCIGSYLRTEEPDPALKALGFVSALKHPSSVGEERYKEKLNKRDASLSQKC